MPTAAYIQERARRIGSKPGRSPARTEYGWIIDRDWLADPDEPKGTPDNAVGMIGPTNVDSEIRELLLRKKFGVTFRLKDEQGTILYTGRYLRVDGKSLRGLEPLTEFGSVVAECTEIWFRNGRKWEIL